MGNASLEVDTPPQEGACMETKIGSQISGWTGRFTFEPNAGKWERESMRAEEYGEQMFTVKRPGLFFN